MMMVNESSSNHFIIIIIQSYAGKYLPALGYKIHCVNPTAKLKINLVGIAMGNPLIDPQHVSYNAINLIKMTITCVLILALF